MCWVKKCEIKIHCCVDNRPARHQLSKHLNFLREKKCLTTSLRLPRETVRNFAAPDLHFLCSCNSQKANFKVSDVSVAAHASTSKNIVFVFLLNLPIILYMSSRRLKSVICTMDYAKFKAPLFSHTFAKLIPHNNGEIYMIVQIIGSLGGLVKFSVSELISGRIKYIIALTKRK